ncbi:hypothetical protein DT603_07690 [Pseudoxanthomonas gei]|uniref:Membrane protein involved in the export of O-antigen and teichoic acid n=1 Tax=Pseudoxanthomonas gei TaxID=1383030 RepID=A0ABX0AB59_9GAMM|nr:hypothetical protein [Pseudoxanthomonas gei]
MLVKAVLGSAGLRIAGMGFGFLVGMQLARGLGADGYGVYGLAMSIIALLTVPTEFGLPQLLTREVAAAQVAGDMGRLRGVLHWAARSSFLISLAVAAVVLAWLLLSGRGVSSPIGKTLLLGLLMVPIVAQGNLRAAALRGLQHIVKGQLPDALVRPALFSLLLFVVPLVFIPLQPALAMGLGAVSAALSLFFAAWMLRREMPNINSIEVSKVVSSRTWWSSALPMALTEGMRVLQAHLVILVLGLMSTVAMVGVYRVASSVALLMALPVTLFNIVSAPIISRLYAEKDRSRLQPLLAWVAIAMTVSVLILAAPFLFSGNFLLEKVFGPEFAEGSTALSILSLGVVANGSFGANAALLNMTGHQNRVTRASGISLALLVIILPVLIKVAGMSGAAFGTSLVLTVWNFLMWRDALRLLSLDTSIGAFLRFRKVG